MAGLNFEKIRKKEKNGSGRDKTKNGKRFREKAKEKQANQFEEDFENE